MTTQSAARSLRLYCGTYTRGESVGIYPMAFDPATGRLDLAGDPCPTKNPSFLALHPRLPVLYAVNELSGRHGRHGRVSAFRIHRDGPTPKLTPVNTVSSAGNAPCHITVDSTGTFAVVANYVDGRVALLPITKDGALQDPCCVVQHEGRGPNKQRQQGPHAHSTLIDHAHDLVYAADLGIDRIMIYRLDRRSRRLVPAEPASAALHPGAGPRHMALHPDGRYLFVIDELDSTLTVFRRDARNPAALTPVSTVSTLPDDVPPDVRAKNTCADVHVHPSGTVVYGSNRGHNSIAVFRFDPASGNLQPLQHVSTRGDHPRNFAPAPGATHLLAANQNTFNIAVFRLAADGRIGPTPVGEAAVPYPVCLRFANGA